jgi:hypothetical protein
VKRGPRSVHGGEKELIEKLGNNDPCPCESGRRFKNCCRNTAAFDGAMGDHYYRERCRSRLPP